MEKARILIWSRWLLALAVTFVFLMPARSQYPSTRLYTLTPNGGKAGATVEVIIGGEDLEEAKNLQFSHPGIRAERIPDPPPPKPDPKKKNQKAPPPPPLKFKVTIAANVPPGIYDARITSKYGISNPRAFVVGQLNEILEKESNDDVPQAQKVELNTTINGVINRNVDVDYYTFTGKKGQRILVHCAATSIDSRLNPQIQMFNTRDRRLGGSWRYSDGDAVFDVVLPADGDYFVRVNEHAYLGGGAEYFYRLTISQLPWIDAVFPAVIEAGKSAQVTLYGRNLPNGKPDPSSYVDGRPLETATVQITAPPNPGAGALVLTGTYPPSVASTEVFEYRVQNSVGLSNPVLLGFATKPVVLESADNNSLEKAQAVQLPCEFCGRIETIRDSDWIKFQAKANEVYSIEGYADRLGSPMDMYFEIWQLGEKPRRLGEYDDHPGIPAQANRVFTRSDDPYYQWRVPADGEYAIKISSRVAGNLAGPRHVYRLRISKDEPDFRLLAVGNNRFSAAGCLVFRGGAKDFEVVCYRQDGFDGEVVLTMEGLPNGVTCRPQVLASGQSFTRLVVEAANNAPNWEGTVKIKGTATINGKQVVREARAGCLVWSVPSQQTNIPAMTRLANSLALAVRDKGAFVVGTTTKDILVPVGGNVAFKLTIDRREPAVSKAQIQIRPAIGIQNLQLPNNINVPNNRNDVEIKFQVRNNVRPGTYNLVFRAFSQFQFNKDPKSKQKKNIQEVQVSPPIQLTIYDKVADATISPEKVTLKPGMATPIVVRVKRLYDYKGPLELQLVLPRGYNGVTAGKVTIPPNANEGKIMLTAQQNAKAGSRNDFVVRVSGKVGNLTLNTDATFGVTVEPPPKPKK
ncbi:MAG: hypothetical protein KatS3mg105_4734 [Gemmatales bacterium]|nr:MAG: hypothetical protein KatS3mg105_4734 [Gemmatales bacterium]